MGVDDVSQTEKRWLNNKVTAWFEGNGREFPWRTSRDPYEVLIAELLLQRTRADLVLPVYVRFLRRYPTPRELARAKSSDVVRLLTPLGFVHRSARLPRLGVALVQSHGGSVPTSEALLQELPGVGRYVANAVQALAFRRRRPLLDPNVLRVLSRVLGVHSEKARPREDASLWTLLEELLPRCDAHLFSLGLIDLGAIVCTPRRPRCFECPLSERCLAFLSQSVSPHPSPADGGGN